MKITFPGGKQVAAEYKGFQILTDQPEKAGGTNAAPGPFDLFLVSIGTCAGYYILAYCQSRELPTDGITLDMEWTKNEETHLIEQIQINVHVPQDFPDRHKGALIKAAETCAVKKHLHHPPEIVIAVA